MRAEACAQVAPGDVKTLEEASERWRLEKGDAVLLEKDAKGTVLRCRADGSYVVKRADGTSRAYARQHLRREAAAAPAPEAARARLPDALALRTKKALHKV